MLTVCFTLLVAPLLVLADQELLLQIVTTNAPTAQVKAAYNGLNVVYGVKFVGEGRYVFVVSYDSSDPPVDISLPKDAVVTSDAVVYQSTFFSYYGVDFPSDYPQLTNTEPLYFIEREVRFTGEMNAMLVWGYDTVGQGREVFFLRVL
ncbi:hypothetical protein BaRGS_00029458 [Batillaria attramentaria]|uniref:Uncharacterized protein n=1 Tax=Batillaria attramentaria TaxID=370345 RepID=A0ABD0JWQ1_9CAEN